MERGETITVKGTLITVLPSADGVVVAADSLGTTTDQQAFVRGKLAYINGSIVTGSGSSLHYAPVPAGRTLHEWLRSHAPIFCATEVISDYISDRRVSIINEEVLKQIAGYLFERYIDVVKVYKIVPSNGLVFRSIIVQNVNSITSISKIEIINDHGVLRLNIPIIEKINIGDVVRCSVFGESEYVTNNVMNNGGFGRPFVSEGFAVLATAPKEVLFRGVREAAYVAYETINTTAHMTTVVPADSLIGGAIDVWCLFEGRKIELMLGVDF